MPHAKSNNNSSNSQKFHRYIICSVSYECYEWEKPCERYIRAVSTLFLQSYSLFVCTVCCSLSYIRGLVHSPFGSFSCSVSLSRHVRATTNALFFSLSFGSTIITHIRIQYTNTQQQSNNKTHREINSMVIVWFVSNALDASEHLSGDMVYVDSQYALYTRFVMRIAHIAL